MSLVSAQQLQRNNPAAKSISLSSGKRPQRLARAPQAAQCSGEASVSIGTDGQVRSAVESVNTRRGALCFLGASALSTVALPSDAVQFENGVCPLGEEGQECRIEQLKKDNDGKGIDYSSNASSNTIKPSAKATDPKYEQQTLEVVATVREYMALSTYDKRRPILSEQIKKEGNDWVAKYAPGGSSRKESARALYSALSSLLGQFAFNGLAPMKGSLAEQVIVNCDKTETFLAQGR